MDGHQSELGRTDFEVATIPSGVGTMQFGSWDGYCKSRNDVELGRSGLKVALSQVEWDTSELDELT